MNLAHLYYFRKLVEVKNYSRAAEELFIAQPTLSLAVSSLERELGCILVKKRRNVLELTEEGEEFYDAVVTATNALDNVTRAIKEQAAEEYGSIRVGMVYSIQDKAWSKAIREYHNSTRSRVQISWKQGTTESLMKDLKKWFSGRNYGRCSWERFGNRIYSRNYPECGAFSKREK